MKGPSRRHRRGPGWGSDLPNPQSSLNSAKASGPWCTRAMHRKCQTSPSMQPRPTDAV